MELTELQRAFVVEYVKHDGNGAAAWRALQPEAERPDQRAWQMLQVPHVLAAVDHAMLRQFRSGAPAAYAVLAEIMRDRSNPPKVRQSCADSILDRAGHTAKRAEAEAATGRAKPISEMSADELAQLIAQNQATVAALEAKMVDITPSLAPSATQVIEHIEETSPE